MCLLKRVLEHHAKNRQELRNPVRVSVVCECEPCTGDLLLR